MKTNYGHPYFEHLTDHDGLNRLKHNTCEVIDLSVLKLNPGEEYTFQSHRREFGLNVMQGTIDVVTDGKQFESVGTRPSPFEGKPAMVYVALRRKVWVKAGRKGAQPPTPLLAAEAFGGTYGGAFGSKGGVGEVRLAEPGRAPINQPLCAA